MFSKATAFSPMAALRFSGSSSPAASMSQRVAADTLSGNGSSSFSRPSRSVGRGTLRVAICHTMTAKEKASLSWSHRGRFVCTLELCSGAL